MNRIKELRKKNKISQKEISIDLNISQATISKWEIGIANPSTANALRLAEYFGVPLDYLMGLSDDDGTGIKKENPTENGGALSAKSELIRLIKTCPDEDLDLLDRLIRAALYKERNKKHL